MTFSDRPLRRKYARIERERRFLVESLPAQLDPNAFERLCDCFIEGTHLRLRRVESPSGDVLVVKLGQKIVDRDAPDDPRRREMTTIYLPESEAARLAFRGLRSTKRRYKLREQGWTFCIDVWEEPVHVIVAEVECPTDAELDAIDVPLWALREVTEDPKYGAVALAASNSS